MSRAEIVHRLREQVRRAADSARYSAGRVDDSDSELDVLIAKHESLNRYLQEGPARRFYASVSDRESIAGLVERQFPEWWENSIRFADAACGHKVNLLGNAELALGDRIDWHRDPVSEFQWPVRFWGSYDLVNRPPADAKVIHELNRHQHLPRLAKAYFLTGYEAYAQEVVSQIDGWIDQNPKWAGINWQSSLELAIRSISWLWAIFLLLPSPSLDERTLRRIVKSLLAQIDQIYRYPSLYTSPNTHLIGEATALWIAGVLFQELPRAEAWRTFGTATLQREMERQFLSDGLHCELSSYYHCYAADFYLLVLALAERNNIDCKEWMHGKLARAFEFVMHVTRGDGTIPLLGDDDGGRALMLSAEHYRSYADGLCSAALLFRRGDFKTQAGRFHEESLWLLGGGAWTAFNALEARTPAGTAEFPEGGYFVQRSGWRREDSHVVFDCGGLGQPSGGHGHADALSINLFSGGRDLLIDPGTSVYNCAPEWRDFFRSTHAHNTVVVDGGSQSQPGGTFAWRKKATVGMRQRFSLPDIEYVDGEHDGYADAHSGLLHRRRLVHIRPNYWIVLDDLRGVGQHDFDFLYHFAPGAQLTIFGDEKRGEIDCRANIGEAGLQLFMYGSEPVRTTAECGQRRPIQGWWSQQYGHRGTNPVLRASVCGTAPVSMMSFLVPGKKATQSRRFKANTNRTIAAVIRDGEYDDLVVMATQDGELHLLDCVMRGEFFWLRTENGSLRRLLAVNAHSFTHAGENVFQSAAPIPYLQAHFWDDGIVIERGEHEGKVYVRDLRDRQFQRF
jgi:Heparinase II/III-like protein/Heparinase II/III N-terminus